MTYVAQDASNTDLNMFYALCVTLGKTDNGGKNESQYNGADGLQDTVQAPCSGSEAIGDTLGVYASLQNGGATCSNCCTEYSTTAINSVNLWSWNTETNTGAEYVTSNEA